jgi:DNA-binding transcriptional ArsR family regulator
MRPAAHRQSALRAPLNDVLATEGSVRVLRELSQSVHHLAAGALTERVRLDRTAVRRALLPLIDAGLVEAHGADRAPSYRLRDAHPLAPAIRALFGAEQARVDDLIRGLREAITTLAPPPMAAWVEGPFVDATDKPGEPMTLVIVDAGRTLTERRDQLQATLVPVEQAADVTIEVQGMTPADLASLSTDAFAARYGHAGRHASADAPRVLLLVGLPPQALLPRGAATSPRPAIRSHADHDARARALGAAIAERLKRDPTLVSRAADYVSQRLLTASSREHHALTEWAIVLETMSPARLRNFLCDPGPRATRLRQSLPFVGVLSVEERAALDAEIARQLAKQHTDGGGDEEGAA